MSRLLAVAYGLFAYAAFFVTICYAIGFVGGFLVPKNIDSGPTAPLGETLLVNAGILLVFAVQHAIMARPRFKEWWAKFVPRPVERSTFVLIASGILMVLFWQWRSLPAVVWEVENAVGRWLLFGLSGAGWATVFLSTFLIDHFDLFGLRQVFLHLRGREHRDKPFTTRGLYGLVRHPLMLGFLIAFWATPVMTVGHLLFACLTTGYILVGTRIEERDLVTFLGDDYRRYQKTTPAFLPLPVRRPAEDDRSTARSVA